MGIFDSSPSKLRRHAVARGAQPSKWVPTFVDLGLIDGFGDVKMNYSFAVATPSDVLFYECFGRLYEQSQLGDPFEYAREYLGHVSIAAISRVRTASVSRNSAETSRKGAVVKDFSWNKSVGAVTGSKQRSVTMAAVVVVDVLRVPLGKSSRLTFGIPRALDMGKTDFGFVGLILPNALSKAFEFGSLFQEFSEASALDASAVVNARAVAQGLLGLIGRAKESVEPLGTEFDGRIRAVTFELG